MPYRAPYALILGGFRDGWLDEFGWLDGFQLEVPGLSVLIPHYGESILAPTSGHGGELGIDVDVSGRKKSHLRCANPSKNL